MQTYKKFLLSFILLFLIISCTRPIKNHNIVHLDEVRPFLTLESFAKQTGMNSLNDNLEFWKQKINSDQGSITYRKMLSRAYLKRYTINKRIEDLYSADSLLSLVLKQPGGKTAESLQAMAHIAITAHKFPEAQKLATQAMDMGDRKTMSHLMLFDILMQRGDVYLAGKHLSRIDNTSTFGFNVRRSKQLDRNGDLQNAIKYMEKAHKRISQNENLHSWTYSNLADLYMHNGEIEKSYKYYLEVLKSNNSGSAYLHSLEGIAWIAYSVDRNPEIALRILNFVNSRIKSPDIYPRLIEIAEYQGVNDQKMRYLNIFFEEATKSKYQGMYDSQLVKLSADYQYKTDLARKLINNELKNRPSPANHCLKAWLYLHTGEKKKALQIIENRVVNRTTDPVPIYQMAEIYYANGYYDRAKRLYLNLRESETELGPIAMMKIENRLSIIDRYSSPISLAN